MTATMADRDEAFRRAERLRTALKCVLTWKRAAEDRADAIWEALDSEAPE